MNRQQAKDAAVDFAVNDFVDKAGIADLVAAGIDVYEENRPKDITPPPKPPVSTGFKVFEDINYRNHPNLQAMGMEPLKIHYESAFFKDRRPQGAHENLNVSIPYPLPDLSKVAEVARNSPQTSCVDIERYWNSFRMNGDEEINNRAIVAYETIMRAYMDNLPKGHVAGLYSTLPIRSYWPVINGTTDLWKKTNDKFAGVAEMVDILFPSIYTFYTDSAQDQSRYLQYGMAQISEAKRLAPDKPCIPFLWPQFHSGDDQFKGRPVPAKYFRRQLDMCREHADGVVIWTLSSTKNTPFTNIPDWWGALTDFLDDL